MKSAYTPRPLSHSMADFELNSTYGYKYAK